MYVKSVFVIQAQGDNGDMIYKNTKTGAVVRLSPVLRQRLEQWLEFQDGEKPEFVDGLRGVNEVLVPNTLDEFAAWRQNLLRTRNKHASMFSLYVEPTLQCQLNCDYCFERGIHRGRSMTPDVLRQSIRWIERYCEQHTGLNLLRVVFFGGEPFLRKDMVRRLCMAYSCVARKENLEYIIEVVTNGELITEDIAQFLSRFNWRRVQITLDGPAEVHDARRYGNRHRPTFDRIWSNIVMLLHSSYIPLVDIRLSLDYCNAPHIPRLLEFIAQTGFQKKIRLSIGFIDPSFFLPNREIEESWLASQALTLWKQAKIFGFLIPDEYTVGPLCIAQAMHSAVIQPDGNLQKCFCTSGQNEYAFGTIFTDCFPYSKDGKYENFKRLDECIDEKCPYLPICGGGCTYLAAVKHGGDEASFMKRYCKKAFLHDINAGLLKLCYGT